MDTKVILTGDCLRVLPTLPAGIADLVILDPPFNQGLKYRDYHDRLPVREFLARTEAVVGAVVPLLGPAAWLWMQLPPRWQARGFLMLEDAGLHWRNTVVWHYNFGPHP
jgi:hypothetical protein